MKLYYSQITSLIKKIESKTISAILIHGSNHGAIALVINLLIQKLNLSSSTIDYKDLSGSVLKILGHNQNFFNKQELIKVQNVTARINKSLQEALTQNQFDNIICFIANESLPKNGIRNLFETAQNLICIGCYYDDKQTIAKIITQQMAKNNKKITNEALNYLSNYLSGDHYHIKNEINKLLSFSHDIELIDIDIIEKTLSSDIARNSDQMCIDFANGNIEKFLSEVAKIQKDDVNQVLILRTLIRYYTNLYIIANQVKSGTNTSLAIKSITPPIFFKYQNDVAKIVSSTAIEKIATTLKKLQLAEVHYKKNPHGFNFLELFDYQ